MSVKCGNKGLEQVVVLLSVTIALLSLSIIPFVRADNINPGVYSVDSKPYGLTYGDWTARWWQWDLSIPKDINPAGDTTGKYCGLKQSGPVWFLAATFGGAAERTCMIPAGKGIMFTILAAECSYAEYPNLKTELELRNCANSVGDTLTNFAVTIDGINLQNLQRYRVQSPLFNVSYPTNNVYGVAPGPTQSVADGYYIFLTPLSTGMHEIHFSGAILGFTTTDIPSYNFATDARYHLMVR